MKVFEKDNLLQRAQQVGQHLTTRLQALQSNTNVVAQVRGLGAMVAMELCKPGQPQQPDADLAKALSAEAAKLGLVLLTCGAYGNVVRILVPLTASDALLNEGLDMLETALHNVTKV